MEALAVSDEHFRDEPGRTLADLLRAECASGERLRDKPDHTLADLLRV
jgi:hypothetical protein